MGATVIERANLSFVIAHDNQWTQSQAPSYEIIDLGEFALVREIGPRPAENMRHLSFEDRRIGVDQPVRAILLNEIIPLIEVSTAQAGLRCTDILYRRHALLRRFPLFGPPPCDVQKKSKYSFCS